MAGGLYLVHATRFSPSVVDVPDLTVVPISALHGDGMEAVVEWVREAVEHRSWAPATSKVRGDGSHDHPH